MIDSPGSPALTGDLLSHQGADRAAAEHHRFGEGLEQENAALAAEVLAARQEYAEEEAEVAELEAAEKAAALEVPLSLRITRELDAELKRRAAAEQISPSALVRRILRQVIHSARGRS